MCFNNKGKYFITLIFYSIKRENWHKKCVIAKQQSQRRCQHWRKSMILGEFTLGYRINRNINTLFG